MSTTIYTSASGWIEQAEKNVVKYPTGLVKTETIYIWPGGEPATNPPSSSGQDIALTTDENGFTTAVVTAYSISIQSENGGSTFSPGIRRESKIIKTGTAIRDTRERRTVTSGDDVLTLILINRETFSFRYLAPVAQETKVFNTPAPPLSAADGDITIIGTPPLSAADGDITIIGTPPFSGGTITQTWALSSYEVVKYGSYYETTQSVEREASIYLFVDPYPGEPDGPQ
jgi:hypothetical protein